MSRIAYIQFLNPEQYPPLEHGSKILMANGWQCFFLGRRSEMTGKIFFHPLEQRRVNFLPRLASSLPAKFEFIAFCFWVFFRLLFIRPNVIYISDPITTPLGVAFALIRIPVVYHEHDSPSDILPFYLKWSRNNLFKNSIATVIPNINRLKKVEQSVINKLLVVRNFASSDEHVVLKPKSENSIVVSYFGTIVPSRLPIDFFRALSGSTQEFTIAIMGYETNQSVGYLRDLVDACKAYPNIKFDYLGAFPRRAMLKKAAEADIGLLWFSNLDDINEHSMAGASNKICDYLIAGLPIVCPSVPEFENLKTELNGIYPLKPEESVDEVIFALKEKYSDLTLRQSLQNQVLTKYNYESEFIPVVHLLEPFKNN